MPDVLCFQTNFQVSAKPQTSDRVASVFTSISYVIDGMINAERAQNELLQAAPQPEFKHTETCVSCDDVESV